MSLRFPVLHSAIAQYEHSTKNRNSVFVQLMDGSTEQSALCNCAVNGGQYRTICTVCNCLQQTNPDPTSLACG